MEVPTAMSLEISSYLYMKFHKDSRGGFLQNPVVDRGLPKTNVGARLTKMSLQHMSLGGPEGPKTRISDHCGF